jgi:long-chain acyl-CoA synthetase
MLYERWRQIAQEHRNEIALQDVALSGRWTFAQLAAATESGSSGAGTVVYPQGATAEFIFTVLRGWRSGKVVCPLETGQSPPVFQQLPTDCTHLKTTSATTGTPRFVAFTDGQLAADAHNIVATMGLRSDWPNLGVISLAHSYGFSNLVLPLLMHGIPLMLTGNSLPEMVRSVATVSESLTLAAVPALWRIWHESGAIPRNVRLAISAGAPLPLPLVQAVFAASGLKIHNFYGSSECGGIAYDATNILRTDAACVGAPMQNVHLSVVAESCLQVCSQAVGQTYWPEPSADLANGCFRTSDLAVISGGLVYLRGRAGDQINVAGRKVSPETIERALLKHPQVLECLVFGVPSRDAERTEEIVAVVMSREREGILRQFVLETLPAWQAPRHWWFVDSVQTNPRGKVSRAEWRKNWLVR